MPALVTPAFRTSTGYEAMNMNIAACRFVVAIGSLAMCLSLQAADWTQWRGPNFNGSTDETGLPEKLDSSTLKWEAPMPGVGAGTPIVVGDRVFVSASDKQSFKLIAMCYDRKSGKEQWRQEVGNGYTTNRNHNYAGPSAVTDGQNVWFYFGTGDLACFTVDGQKVWQRSLTKEHGSFNFMWIYGSSPLLYKGKLYIQVLHNERAYDRAKGQPGVSYLLAIDPKSGKDLWKEERPTEANNESQEAYSTPIPCEAGGKSQILVAGGDVITGHDPETGKELWRAGDWNTNHSEQYWRLVPSPVVAGDLAIACAPKGGPVMAFKTDGSGKQEWISRDITSDVCVPLVYQGSLFILNGDRDKSLSCVEPATGKVKWSLPIESRPVFRASPIGADDKIYCMNEGGEVFVLSAKEPKMLSRHQLAGANAGHSRASIVPAGGMVFVRTADKLVAFGK